VMAVQGLQKAIANYEETQSKKVVKKKRWTKNTPWRECFFAVFSIDQSLIKISFLEDEPR
jgi:hypothetical protein